MKVWSSMDLLRLMLLLTPRGADVPIRKLAKLFNLSSTELHDLLRGRKHISRKMNLQLTHLENFLALLGDSIRIEDEMAWLAEPNKAFNHKRPIDMLKDKDGYAKLMFMVDQINSGAFQ